MKTNKTRIIIAAIIVIFVVVYLAYNYPQLIQPKKIIDNPPVISAIWHSPAKPKVNETVYLCANATDDFSIRKVYFKVANNLISQAVYNVTKITSCAKFIPFANFSWKVEIIDSGNQMSSKNSPQIMVNK